MTRTEAVCMAAMLAAIVAYASTGSIEFYGPSERVRETERLARKIMGDQIKPQIEDGRKTICEMKPSAGMDDELRTILENARERYCGNDLPAAVRLLAAARPISLQSVQQHVPGARISGDGRGLCIGEGWWLPAWNVYDIEDGGKRKISAFVASAGGYSEVKEFGEIRKNTKCPN